jgi:hypothetical protein
VQIFVRLCLVSLLFATSLVAASSLEHARRAQALLGPQVWSQVITVRNSARQSPYPRVVHALVFELVGILWFYTDVNGTQSFSLHRGRLAEEKKDFGPLLRDIEPGFERWVPVARGAASVSEWPRTPLADARSHVALPATFSEPLPNGCFIESVAALRQRLNRGLAVEDPRLLSFYVPNSAGKMGHTVLAYESGGSVEVVDPSQPGQPLIFPPATAREPLALARALEGSAVVKARFHSLRELAGEFEAVAAAERKGATAAKAGVSG